jgi:1-deoxyxylulose-5-phosphate synthase
MEYVKLGKTELKVSKVCLGCMSFGNESEWMLRGPDAKKIIQRAIDLGINYFDTADVYSDGVSEEILGEYLSGNNDVAVATKVGLQFGSDPSNSGLSAKWTQRQAEGSLSRLRRDRIDLYQIHRWDYKTPIVETLRALTELKRQGKVSYIGASTMFAWQFMQSLALSEREGLESFVSMQNRYNLVYREEEREMIPLCRLQGIGLLPYSPLARGFLSGKYERTVEPNSVRYRNDVILRNSYFSDNEYDVLETVKEVASEKGVTPSQVSLAWLFSKPWIGSAILGATKVEHVDDAVAALSIKLSVDEIKRMEERYLPHRLVGPIIAPE